MPTFLAKKYVFFLFYCSDIWVLLQDPTKVLTLEPFVSVSHTTEAAPTVAAAETAASSSAAALRSISPEEGTSTCLHWNFLVLVVVEAPEVFKVRFKGGWGYWR